MRLPPSVLAGVLLLLFVVHASSASLIKTPTYDEPVHIGAGLSYLRTREFKVNLQHPPLLKELVALPLLAAGVRGPVSAEGWAALGPVAPAAFQWELGNAVLFANDPARVLFWSRLPLLLLTALLGWVLWAWGRAMLGPAAGLSALLLFAFDPGLLAHGALVTTDTGCAALSTLCLFALWRYLRERTPRRLLLCGVALGAALAAKFSALLLLPIVAVLLLFATREASATPAARAAPDVGDDHAQPDAAGDHARRLLGAGAALLAVTAVAVLVVAVVYLGRNPWLYVEGLRLVNADHNPDYWPFMAGQFRPRFWSYYVVVYLLKEPLPSIVLAAVGVWAIVRRGAARPIDRAFLILPPLAFVGAYTALSHDLGLRYLIPALPFLHLLGGAGLAALLQRGLRGRMLGGVLVVWLGLGSLGIYPDHLSYFNEAACALAAPARIGLDGGSRCGTSWLDDSNVDWGQGLGQLAVWLAQHPSPAPVWLAYFGSVPPERYGVRAQPLDARELQRPPPPGRYVLSAHVFARLRGALAARGAGWLLSQSPSAVVGHAYYVFDVP
jgi:hypothetical protein